MWVTREVAAAPEAAWSLLADTRAWPRWGPPIAGVECGDRVIRLGTRGRIRTVVGLRVPFEITSLEEGRSWRWSVAGVPATAHRVEVVAPGRCRLGIELPLVVLPYALVCRVALRRLAAELEAGATTEPRSG